MIWVDLKQTVTSAKGISAKSQPENIAGATGDAVAMGPGRQADGIYSEFENWWPGLGRWQMGLKLENAIVEFGEGKYWD